jgi:raffinose/stachyose/melibiose transport system substrate-binding protein
MVEGTSDAIKDPFLKQIAKEVEKSQWIAIAIDQLLGPDTGRVFNDASADIAAGNLTAEKATKTIEQSWEQNRQ